MDQKTEATVERLTFRQGYRPRLLSVEKLSHANPTLLKRPANQELIVADIPLTAECFARPGEKAGEPHHGLERR